MFFSSFVFSIVAFYYFCVSKQVITYTKILGSCVGGRGGGWPRSSNYNKPGGYVLTYLTFTCFSNTVVTFCQLLLFHLIDDQVGHFVVHRRKQNRSIQNWRHRLPKEFSLISLGHHSTDFVATTIYYRGGQTFLVTGHFQ